MKRLLAAFGLITALAACAADQAPPPAHEAHTLPPKISLDVQTINLADRSGLQPAASPYNGNHFSPTISDAIKQWAGDRLQAGGSSGQAIIVIKDASLIAQPLPIQQGMDGWFTRQQGTKYIARAEVSLEANGHQGFAMADAVATRSVTLPENPSAIEKQDAYYSLLNSLMKDLGQNLETGIQMHMSTFIVAPQSYGAQAVPITTSMSSDGDITPIIIEAPTGNTQMSSGGMQAAPQTVVTQTTVTQTTAPLNQLGAQMQAQMQPPQLQPTQAAVAAATVPYPTQVQMEPQTMVISQSSAAPVSSYASPQAMMAAADTYAASGPTTITSQQLTPPVNAPQAPMFGTTAVRTVPDLASTPSSFPDAADTGMSAPTPVATVPGTAVSTTTSYNTTTTYGAPPAIVSPSVVASGSAVTIPLSSSTFQ